MLPPCSSRSEAEGKGIPHPPRAEKRCGRARGRYETGDQIARKRLRESCRTDVRQPLRKNDAPWAAIATTELLPSILPGHTRSADDTRPPASPTSDECRRILLRRTLPVRCGGYGRERPEAGRHNPCSTATSRNHTSQGDCRRPRARERRHPHLAFAGSKTRPLASNRLVLRGWDP